MRPLGSLAVLDGEALQNRGLRFPVLENEPTPQAITEGFAIDDGHVGAVLGEDHQVHAAEINITIPGSGIRTGGHEDRVAHRGGIDPTLNGWLIQRNSNRSRVPDFRAGDQKTHNQ